MLNVSVPDDEGLSSGASYFYHFYMEEFVMQIYQKLTIGTLIVCLLAACAVPASAAVNIAPTVAITRAVLKVKSLFAKTGKTVSKSIWDNKGSILIGTGAMAVAAAPASFFDSIGAVFSGRSNRSGSQPMYGGNLVHVLFYAAATIFCVLGVRFAWNYLKDYKNWLPLIIVGVLLCCCSGVAEAGMTTVPDAQLGAIKPPFWDVIGFIILVLTLFIGGV
jgi:hypothetical protein